jgi:2-phosphosulfolactate phosphatase
MPTLHVLLRKEDIDPERLHDKVVVVVDVLVATSTIVHAFALGVVSVWPALDRSDALRIAERLEGCVLAGEHLAETLPGFAPASPDLLAAHGLFGRDLVYCTTNGTRALSFASGAAHVYAGALLNGAALAAHIVKSHPGMSVLIVCSGSVGRFNLEDFHGAGHLASHLVELSEYDLTDTALAATFAYSGSDTRAVLCASRVGRMMLAQALDAEVDLAALRDTTDVIPMLSQGRLVRVAA